MLGTVHYNARGNGSDGEDSLAARNSVCPTHGETISGKISLTLPPDVSIKPIFKFKTFIFIETHTGMWVAKKCSMQRMCYNSSLQFTVKGKRY